jgi:hypothetical protein
MLLLEMPMGSYGGHHSRTPAYRSVTRNFGRPQVPIAGPLKKEIHLPRSVTGDPKTLLDEWMNQEGLSLRGAADALNDARRDAGLPKASVWNKNSVGRARDGNFPAGGAAGPSKDLRNQVWAWKMAEWWCEAREPTATLQGREDMRRSLLRTLDNRTHSDAEAPFNPALAHEELAAAFVHTARRHAGAERLATEYVNLLRPALGDIARSNVAMQRMRGLNPNESAPCPKSLGPTWQPVLAQLRQGDDCTREIEMALERAMAGLIARTQRLGKSNERVLLAETLRTAVDMLSARARAGLTSKRDRREAPVWLAHSVENLRLRRATSSGGLLASQSEK